MSYWSSIKNDYKQTCDAFQYFIDGDIMQMIYIDAWKTDDNNEEGTTIAKVIKTKSGDVCVVYHDAIAKHDRYAQEIIQDIIAELRR